VEVDVEVLDEVEEELVDVLVDATGKVEVVVVVASKIVVVVTFVPPLSEQPGRNTNKNRKNTTNNRIKPLNAIRR
jgi:uncharacterized protein YjfI (DUF2170 family)